MKVGNYFLDYHQIHQMLCSDQKIELDETSLENLDKNFAFLQHFSEEKIIYGLNTGFGPMAKVKISQEDQINLQYNLIRSHASGSGDMLPPFYVKAVMLARLNSLMQGYSGINRTVVELLRDFINNKIYPLIFVHGGVGASGDLVQLSHLALALIGEGEVFFNGELVTTQEVMQQCGLKPIDVKSREGLALINGTSCMTGVGLINLIRSFQLFDWILLASAILNEIMESYDDYFSEALNEVKLHEGQRKVAEKMRYILSQSKLMKDRSKNYLKNNPNFGSDKVQEYYSLRCVPQVMGPVQDTLEYSMKVLVNEFNSVNDNPIVDSNRCEIFHGGNFHGDYVSFEMDKMRIAMAKMSMLSERQLNFLLNDALNQKLPPFVNLGIVGLNLGMQGAQFTATSTVAENQALSTSMYIHSIPNNKDNQDIVSMGTNSAILTRKVIDNAYEVVAIHMITILQAIDYLKIEDRLSPVSATAYRNLRKLVPAFVEDTPKYKEIKTITDYLVENAAFSM